MIILFFLSFWTYVFGKIGLESPTGALVAFPMGPSSLNTTTFPVTPAEFGIHTYGGHVLGYLVISETPHYHTECPLHSYRSNSKTTEPIGENPYVKLVPPGEKWILIIDRGDCYFVDKVKHAEDMGASAVIMIDHTYEGLVIMWPPENYNQDKVSIPSVFMSRSNGERLYRELGVRNWSPRNPGGTKYPPAALNGTWHFHLIVAEIRWGIPHPDDRVEWELWSGSDTTLAYQFKHDFRDIAVNLSLANDTVFTPRYFMLDGRHWGCTASNLPCGKQCTNNGLFCAEDPEHDFSIGLDGMDVVQENLRQICIYNLGRSSRNPQWWWDYVRLFDSNCYNTSDVAATFTEACSYAQIEKVNTTLLQQVQKCIRDSGGYQYSSSSSSNNSLLWKEVQEREHSGIYILPTVLVNNFAIHGKLHCPEPISQATCQIFNTICAGFLEGTEPAICLQNKDYCAAGYDCMGLCGGRHQRDKCGQCLLTSDARWDNCVGCDHVAFSNKTLNPCGQCILTNLTNFATFGQDCAHICNGKHVVDRCNTCALPGTSDFDKCVGCDRIPFSNKTINPCGICLDSNDPHFNSTGRDCSGKCGGNFVIDKCGKCLDPTDTHKDECVGCDGIANSGKAFNPCRQCINSSRSDFKTYGTDCNGICNGRSTIDRCGQCLPPGSPLIDACVGCDGIVNSTKRINPCGVCYDSLSVNFNITGKDCRGQCGGSYSIDECGACLESNDTQRDNCVGCDGKISPMRLNPCGLCISHLKEDFPNYGKDCNGTCHGTYVTDRCGKCFSSKRANGYDSCVGCDGHVDSGMAFNPCNHCINRSISNFAIFGKDCNGVCDGSHFKDQCGKCIKPNDPKENECLGCDKRPNSGFQYNPCQRCIAKNRTDFKIFGQDCNGVCNGPSVRDTCGVCRKRTDINWNECFDCNNVKNGKAKKHCGYCMEPTDPLFNAKCDVVKQKKSVISTNGNGGSDSGSSHPSKEAYELVAIVSVVACFCLCLICAVMAFVFKRQKEGEKRFNDLMEQYQVLDEFDGPAGEPTTRKTQKIKLPEDDDEFVGVNDEPRAVV